MLHMLCCICYAAYVMLQMLAVECCVWPALMMPMGDTPPMRMGLGDTPANSAMLAYLLYCHGTRRCITKS